MQKFPFSLRSSLVAVLLPPMIALFTSVFAMNEDDATEAASQIYGVSQAIWIIFLCGVVPVLMLLLTFLKGYWRFALVTVCTMVIVVGIFASMEGNVPVDARIIEFKPLIAGADVYCNDVKLGTIPFKITVGELKKKVPAWTEPPEQTWFVEAQPPLYTWFPWDDFLRERSEARFFLDPKQSPVPFDAKSSYWWRFEYQGAKACCYAPQQARENFDKVATYRFNEIVQLIFPSTWVHTDLLLGVLEDDTPSPEWIDYAAHHTDNLIGILYDKTKGKIRDAAILTAIAKCRYGLSETPTPEECDKAIERILEENKTRFYFSSNLVPFLYQYNPNDDPQLYFQLCNYFGDNYNCTDVIVQHAIRAMGPACKEPLVRRFRSQEKWDDYEKPLYYMLGEYRFPEVFEEIFCRYAMERNGFRCLINYPDERLLPLLQTLLATQESPFSFIFGESKEFEKATALLAIENSLLEPMIRAYLAETLPKIRTRDVGQLLGGYAETRMKFDGADREEIAGWIESLRIDGRQKTAALQQLRKPPETKKTLGQEVFWNSPLLEQTLTETLLKEWIEKNPDRMLEDLIVELDPKLVDEAENIRGTIIWRVIHRNKPEAKDIITTLWKKNAEYKGLILGHAHSFGTPMMIISYDESGVVQNRRIRLPGTYTDMDISRSFFSDVEPGKPLPEYFVALFDELSDPKQCAGVAPQLSNVTTPEAVALLTKWSASDSAFLKRQASESLELLTLRMKLKDERRRLFGDLVSGKIGPDDLLLPTKPFVWNGERYAEK